MEKYTFEPGAVEVSSIENVHKTGEKENGDYNVYAKINGNQNDAWILTIEGYSITVNGYFWTEETKKKMEEFTSKKIENPNINW